MENCSLAFKAVKNLKETPPKLYVHGSVMLYGMMDSAELVEKSDENLSSIIKILELKIHLTGGPLQGVCYPVNFVESGAAVAGYEMVEVHFGPVHSQSIEVEVFK